MMLIWRHVYDMGHDRRRTDGRNIITITQHKRIRRVHWRNIWRIFIFISISDLLFIYLFVLVVVVAVVEGGVAVITQRKKINKSPQTRRKDWLVC